MKNGDQMGRFSVDIELVNYKDLVRAEDGSLDPKKVRRMTIQGIVDSGAAKLVLPSAVVKELGLGVNKTKIKVRYADGRRALRSESGPVQVVLNGRQDIFSAIVEPKRDTALIGAIILEDLDLLVDCKTQRLRPRDPDNVMYEIG